jgi:hypothetical protein
MAGYTNEELDKVAMVTINVYDRSSATSCLVLNLRGPDKGKVLGAYVDEITKHIVDGHNEASLDAPNMMECISDTIRKEGSSICYRINGLILANIDHKKVAGVPHVPLNDRRFLVPTLSVDEQPILNAAIHVGNIRDFDQGGAGSRLEGMVRKYNGA